MELAEKIYAAVRLIPRGKVATYSQIAALVGNRNLRRYVGNALHKNPSNEVTPCHRVVNAKGFCSGSFAFGGPAFSRKSLKQREFFLLMVMLIWSALQLPRMILR